MKGPVVNVHGQELCAVCRLCESLSQLSVQVSGTKITAGRIYLHSICSLDIDELSTLFSLKIIKNFEECHKKITLFVPNYRRGDEFQDLLDTTEKKIKTLEINSALHPLQ